MNEGSLDLMNDMIFNPHHDISGNMYTSSHFSNITILFNYCKKKEMFASISF